jgi:ABC-type Fe3+ transport system permease subunit
MERSKFIAIITGAISLILAIAYLLLVTVLDFRGEMLPAPISQLPVFTPVQQLGLANSILPVPGIYPEL